MLKPLTSGETPLRQTPVFLLLVSCASHPWPYRGWFLWRFWGSLFRPATPLWFEWFFMSSVYHCSIAFLVSLLFYRSERNWGTLNSRVDLSKNWFESGSVNPESVRRACPSEPGNEHVLEQKRTLPDWLEPSWLLEIGCPEHFDFVTLRHLQAQLLGSQGMRATLDWWPPCWINWTLSRHCLGVWQRIIKGVRESSHPDGNIIEYRILVEGDDIQTRSWSWVEFWLEYPWGTPLCAGLQNTPTRQQNS